MTRRETPEPRIVPRSEHRISRGRIDGNALKVLYRLHRAGFLAFLVGGAPRDLLLGRTPKDYDIATDARPPQVRRLFKNSRIIGRRFRLAHIYFREGIVEVATFRSPPDPEAQAGEPGELLITDDNVFGTPGDDALRRDFTVNALFYNIADFSVIDFVDGMRDLERSVIRVIGDPDVRFREDPVRMTRACEMAARLGFTIHPATQEGIVRQVAEIDKAAPARLVEEIGQIMRCGEAASAAQWLQELGIMSRLFPELDSIPRARELGRGDFSTMFRVMDRRAAEGDPASEIGILACLCLPSVLVAAPKMFAADAKAAHLRDLAGEIVAPLLRRLALAKHKVESVTQSLLALRTFTRRRWNAGERVRYSRRGFFEDALLVYEVWTEATDADPVEVRRWRRVAKARPRSQSKAPAKSRAKDGRPGRSPARKRRRRRGRRRKR